MSNGTSNGTITLPPFLKKWGNQMTHGLTIAMLSGILGLNVAGEHVGIATKQYVDTQITDVRSQVGQNADKLDEIDQKQNVALRIALAEEICRLYFLRMDANGELYVQLNQSFEQRQEEYKMVNNGERYPAATECNRPN